MESEKLMYWVTLGVLAMASTTGFVTGHRGWSDRLADRSIAVMSEAQQKVANYAEIAATVLGDGETDSGRSPRGVEVRDYVQNEVQARLACVQRTLVRRQSEMARVQSMRTHVRISERPPRAVVWPNQHIVVEVPQPPQVDTF